MSVMHLRFIMSLANFEAASTSHGSLTPAMVVLKAWENARDGARNYAAATESCSMGDDEVVEVSRVLLACEHVESTLSGDSTSRASRRGGMQLGDNPVWKDFHPLQPAHGAVIDSMHKIRDACEALVRVSRWL